MSGINILIQQKMKTLTLKVVYTEVSHSNGPFVFQPGHLILTNSFSKEVINPADISTSEIWDQSDNWLKSYGQKVNFLLTER